MDKYQYVENCIFNDNFCVIFNILQDICLCF